MKDERGLRIAAQGTMLIIPTAYTFTAERLLETQLRTGTADNDINAIRSGGYLPQGYHIMRRLTDSDQFFIKTDVPDGLKMFQRSPLKKGVEGDFETGNVRYKVRERYLWFTAGEESLEQKVCITVSSVERRWKPSNFNATATLVRQE